MKGRYFIGKVPATACIGMAAMQAASAAVEYRVTVVGPPDSRVNAINNAGININDAGQIAATGARNGQYYAVRLDLIRPHLETAPALDDADLPELLTPVPPAP